MIIFVYIEIIISGFRTKKYLIRFIFNSENKSNIETAYVYIVD